MKHNWEYKRLGDVCHVIGGSTPKTEVSEFWNGTLNWFTPAEISEKKYYASSERKITEEAVEATGLTILPPGTVLLTSRAPIGKVGIATDYCYCNQGFKNLICKDLLFNEYLYYTLIYFNDDIKDKGRGATFKEISKKVTESISIPVPPMETQEQIVAELDQINDLIAKNRELLSQLDSLAQSLFYDTFGDPITNPKGFPIKTLKDVCILKSGDSSANRLPDGKVPYVKVGDMNLLENKQGILTSSKFVNIGNKTKLLFPIGTTIFPKRGGAILTNKKRLTKVQICCDLNIMGAIPQNIHPLYLYFFFLEKDFSELVDGSTVPQINNTDIYLLKIQVPPLALQEEFASKVEAIEAQKVKVDAEISELQNLLDARMDYWFN